METPYVDDAIALARENARNKKCDCLDCRALKTLADEVERLREQRRVSETPSETRRSVDDILVGDAKTWATLKPGDIRVEHELLRRALENAQAQIALWSPIVAWRHRCPKCQAGLICSGCENPWSKEPADE